MRTERTYSNEEIFELLEKAERRGLNLEKGSDLEKLTLEELEKLVNTKQ